MFEVFGVVPEGVVGVHVHGLSLAGANHRSGDPEPLAQQGEQSGVSAQVADDDLPFSFTREGDARYAEIFVPSVRDEYADDGLAPVYGCICPVSHACSLMKKTWSTA